MVAGQLAFNRPTKIKIDPRREEPVDPGEPNNTDAANVTVEPKDQDLPPTGVASTTITSVLGALALSIGSALGFRKKRK